MGIYYNGQGVPQNFVTAYMWPNLATSNGNDLANEAGDAIAKVQNAIVSECPRRQLNGRRPAPHNALPAIIRIAVASLWQPYGVSTVHPVV